MLSGLEYSGRLDSEYYRPKWLAFEALIHKRGGKPLSDVADFLIGPFGSAFNVDNYTKDKKYRYIRGKDVKPMQLMNNDNVYMPQADFDRLSKYALKKNDLLLSVVGTVGNAAIVEEKNLPAIFSCKSTVIRTKTINPYYLLSYLNSKFGQSLLRRKERGAVQQGLNLDDLKRLDFYQAEQDFQDATAEAYRAAANANVASNMAYRQAETLLLHTLSLSSFEPTCEKANVKSLSESFGKTGRLDAEHYQPKYEQLYKILAANNNLFKLGDRLSFNQRGSQPDYADKGLPVVNSKHVQRGEVNMTDTRFATMPDKANAVVIKKGDVLINGTGVGTIGRAAPYLHASNALPDNHVTVLRTDALSPICLALYLNSIAGQYQVEQYFKGSSGQIELYPADIANFWCPELDESVQNKIDALIEESFALKSKSKQLLEAAKRAVEIAIEQDEAAAMAYLAALEILP